ncbi:MAG: hypothetical protein ACKOFF_02905 [Acidimicrobiales bacterium]
MRRLKWAGPALLAVVLAVPGMSTAATKQKMSTAVKVCEEMSEEDQADGGYEYLADESSDPCRVVVTLKPRTPKRSLVLQKWDEESGKWAEAAKASTNSKGTASITVPDTFEDDCLDYVVIKFRVVARKSGKNAALNGTPFTVGFASDPQSDPCLAESEDESEDDSSDSED